MFEIVKKNPVVAILRGVEDEALIAYLTSLYEGGLRAFEISLSEEGALAQIERAKEELPSDALVGAGTVLTVAQAKDAQKAGADFMLSPSTNPEVLDYCKESHIKILPGVYTPTDVSVCLAHGYDTLKLFPASSLPLHYVKDLQGPFPKAKYVAVGGVSPKNALSYLQAGYIGVGIGSSLVDKALLKSGAWEEITKQIKEFMKEIAQ